MRPCVGWAKRSVPTILISHRHGGHGANAPLPTLRIFKQRFAISWRVSPEVCWKIPYPPVRGRRECRARDAPAAWRAEKTATPAVTVTTVTPESPGIPRAMVYSLLRALPGDQDLVDTVTSGITPAGLTPTSRRQDHTTSPSASGAFVKGAIRVHRIPSRVRDDREPPL